MFFFVFNDTATTEIYTYLTHSFPTRRSSDLRASSARRATRGSTCRRAWTRTRPTCCSTAAKGRSPATTRSPPTPASTCACTWARSEEHTSELQSLMRISYAVFCLKKNSKTLKLTTQAQYNSETEVNHN